MNLREKLQKARVAADVPPTPVATPEWPDLDGQLYVKTISSFELDQTLSDDDDEGNGRARFAAKVLADKDNHRILTDDDAAWLGHKESPVIERIWWAGRRQNGLTDENRRGLIKNSADAGSDGSLTSSPEQSTPDTVST